MTYTDSSIKPEKEVCGGAGFSLFGDYAFEEEWEQDIVEDEWRRDNEK